MTQPYSIECIDERLPGAGHIFLRSQSYDDTGLHFVIERVEKMVPLAAYRVTFPHHRIVAYRMVVEECRLEDWASRETNPAVSLLTPSPWIAEISVKEPLMDVHYKDARHYMVSTEDECFDILTTGEGPKIEELPPK